MGPRGPQKTAQEKTQGVLAGVVEYSRGEDEIRMLQDKNLHHSFNIVNLPLFFSPIYSENFISTHNREIHGELTLHSGDYNQTILEIEDDGRHRCKAEENKEEGEENDSEEDEKNTISYIEQIYRHQRV